MLRRNLGVNVYDYLNIKRFKRGQIMGLTKHLSGIRFETPGFDRTNGKMIDRAAELGLTVGYNYSHLPGEQFVFKTPRKITGEQTKFGKAWLREYFFKKDGEPRGGKRTEYVSERVLEIAKSVTRFEFIGVLGVANNNWVIHSFIPVYRAYDKQGHYFDYAPIHWGEPVIMEGA